MTKVDIQKKTNGDVFTLQKFIELVEDDSIQNSDGVGYFLDKDGVRHGNVWWTDISYDKAVKNILLWFGLIIKE